MQKSYLLFPAVIVLFLLSGCSSGKKQLEQGNYYAAVVQAVERLRSNPDHRKSRETLSQAYALAVQTLEKDAEIKLAGSDPFRYTQAIGYYQTLNALRDDIRRAPGALAVVPQPESFHDRIEDLKALAAEENYSQALRLLDRGSRLEAREAFLLFQRAGDFVPEYKEVASLMEEARFKATLKVLVEQIPVPGRYELSGGYFQDKVEEYLNTHFRSSPFVRFYNRQSLEAEQVPYVDQYLRLQFDDFSVGETHLTTSTETFTKDSVVVGSVNLDDGTKKDVYNSVSAKLTVNQKEVISGGLLSMQVYDAGTDALLLHKKFKSQFVWRSRWGFFNGDQRALSKADLALCQDSELPSPPPQELFTGFTEPIYLQLIPEINSYYGKF